jgi:hypothetical protein
VFENRVLRRGGSRRRLHNEELYNFYASPNIIRVNKSKRMRWAGHVACNGGIKMHTKFWPGNLEERDHSEELGINGKIILKSVLGK